HRLRGSIVGRHTEGDGMTRQAAPPAQRWWLVIIALLAAPWVGQGAAFAYSMSVNPQSGRAGTTVTVTLSDFGPECAVLFDGKGVAAVDTGCDGPTTLVFDVPQSASVGEHEIHAVGGGLGTGVIQQTMTFTVRAAPATTAPAPTTPPISSPPVSEATSDVNVGEVGPATVPGPATTRATTASSSPTTVAGQPATTSTAGELTSTSSSRADQPAGFAAGCKAGEFALM